MAVLVKGLADRNVALKKTYASSLGHLVRVAKETSVAKLLETLENRYLEAEDEGRFCSFTSSCSIFLSRKNRTRLIFDLKFYSRWTFGVYAYHAGIHLFSFSFIHTTEEEEEEEERRMTLIIQRRSAVDVGRLTD